MRAMLGIMSTMNISLPDSLKDFVDEQVTQGGYGTSSEYVRELIRKDQDRLQLRGLLLAGARSEQTKPVDDAYFDRLRRKAQLPASLLRDALQLRGVQNSPALLEKLGRLLGIQERKSFCHLARGSRFRKKR
jgi:antitoxin ParD1/3/4